MALVAANDFPAHRQTLLPIVIDSTLFIEPVGQFLTNIALKHSPYEPENEISTR